MMLASRKTNAGRTAMLKKSMYYGDAGNWDTLLKFQGEPVLDQVFDYVAQQLENAFDEGVLV